jgi:hypothetical protein
LTFGSGSGSALGSLGISLGFLDEYPNTTLENIRTMINSSYGMASVLLRPTRATQQGEPYSPFLQIEPAMAYQYGLPLLLVIEDGFPAGGIWGGAGQLAPFTPIVWLFLVLYW